MAVTNSFATFFGGTYPAESDVLNTAPTYGDPVNVFNGSYDPGAGGVVPGPSDVRLGVSVGAGSGTLRVPAVTDVRAGVAFDASDTLTGLLDLPSVNDVRLAVQFDQATKTGNVRVPAEQYVQLGYNYDTNDSLTGTLDPGAGGAMPDAGDVRAGIPVGFGVGTLQVPSVANVRLGVDYDTEASQTGQLVVPLLENVLEGIGYGYQNEYVGTYETVSINDVRIGVAFGNAGLLTGTVSVPAASDVRLGVAVDQATGTVRIPIEGDVRAGVAYGASDVLTGTLDVTGDPPIFPNQSDVRLGVTYGTDSQPAQFTGNVRVPPADKVENGYQYDTLDSVTGTAVSGSYVLVIKDFQIVRGDDYAGDRSLLWPLDPTWPDLSSATFKFGVETGEFEKAATLTAEGIALSLTKDETGALRGVLPYDLQATIAGGAVITLAAGDTYVSETQTDPPANQPIDVGWMG